MDGCQLSSIKDATVRALVAPARRSQIFKDRQNEEAAALVDQAAMAR